MVFAPSFVLVTLFYSHLISLTSDSRNYVPLLAGERLQNSANLSLYFAGERPKNHATHTHNVGRGRQERTARAVYVQPMPRKKDWGEATRRSDRLTTSIEPVEPTQSEEPAEPAERITETEADQDDHAMESSDKNVLQGLTPQQVNDLLALLAQS